MARQRPTHIGVFRALHLGDLLCAVPAMRALRRAYPAARITLIGLPWARQLVSRYPDYLDDFIAVPDDPSLLQQEVDLGSLTDLLTEVRSRRLDLAIQLHGSGLFSNRLVAAFGARHTIGFHPRDAAPPSDGFVPYPDDLPEPIRLLEALRPIGVPPAGHHLEFPILADDRAQLADLAPDLQSHPYVCLHPGASDHRRRWPVERFRSVASELADSGYRVVVTGSADEAPLSCDVAGQVAGGLDLGGRLSLGAFAAVLHDARVVVTNDTGTSHLAAAVGAPSVTIFVDSDPERWAPLDRERHHILGVAKGSVLRDVSAGEVSRTAIQLLAGRTRDAA